MLRAMRVLKFALFILVAGALLVVVALQIVADDSADLVEIHEVDNLDEHKARIGSYASAFSDGWCDTAFLNARLYIESCHLRASDSIMLSNLFASHSIEALHGFVRRQYGRARTRMPLSGIYGLAAVYEGLDNDMRPRYASVESSEHYRKIMNDRAFFLSVYSYTRPFTGGWDNFSCEYVDGRVVHNLNHYDINRELELHRAKAREIERRAADCDSELVGLQWVRDGISAEAVDGRCERLRRDYDNARRQALQAFLGSVPTHQLRNGDLYDFDAHLRLAQAITEFEKECTDIRLGADFDLARNRIAKSARSFNRN